MYLRLFASISLDALKPPYIVLRSKSHPYCVGRGGFVGRGFGGFPRQLLFLFPVPRGEKLGILR